MSPQEQRPLRADARRNYDRILAAAGRAVAAQGADTSLEEIARQAGVGSATLHRHFPSRTALLNAVFHDRVQQLCNQAGQLAHAADPAAALLTWLRAVGAYVGAVRGLATTLMPVTGSAESSDNVCAVMISEAGQTLLSRAQDAGAVRADVSIHDLLTLINALSLATDHHPQAAAEVGRLLTLMIAGIMPGHREA